MRTSALPPLGLDAGDDCLGAALIPAMHQHARSAGAKPFRDYTADTVGRTGDENCLVLEFHVQSLLVLLRTQRWDTARIPNSSNFILVSVLL